MSMASQCCPVAIDPGSLRTCSLRENPYFREKVGEPSLKELGWFLLGRYTSMLLASESFFLKAQEHEISSPITSCDLQPESWIFVVGFGSTFFVGQSPLFW